MFYLTRDLVCERLKVSLWASYKLVPATDIPRIPSDRVINLLNKARRSHQEPLEFIPSDIVTPEEAEAATGISARSLLTWTRRAVKSPPHFRLNKQTTRFQLSSLEEWLRRRTHG